MSEKICTKYITVNAVTHVYTDRSKLTFTCSKLIIETPKQCVKYSNLTMKTRERRRWSCFGI